MILRRPLLSSFLHKTKKKNVPFLAGASPVLVFNVARNFFFSATTSIDKDNRMRTNTIFASNKNTNSRRSRQKEQRFTTTTTTSLPIIEITSLHDDDEDNNKDKEKEALFKIGRELDDAFRTHGFAYLSYTDDVISSDLIKQVLQLSHAFFDLPLSKKQLVSIETDVPRNEYDYQEAPVRGYQNVGDNITLGKPDYHEAIDFVRDCPPPHANVSDDEDDDNLKLFGEESTTHHPLIGMNKWPKQPSEFEFVFQKYIQTMLRLGHYVLKSIAVANNSIPSEEFQSKFNDPFWIMRVIRYPPTTTTSVVTNSNEQQLDDDANNNNMGCGQHTDYGCLTFVLADDLPNDNCLQVYDQYTKTWINAPSIPNTFVINCGDMLSHWSCQQYQSTPHRVISPKTCQRISVPFFFEPNFDSIIHPIPQYFLNNNSNSDDHDSGLEACTTATSSSIKFGDHVSHRLLSNFRYSPDIHKNLQR